MITPLTVSQSLPENSKQIYLQNGDVQQSWSENTDRYVSQSSVRFLSTGEPTDVIDELNDKIDEINDKIDESNDKIDELNDKVDELEENI